MAPRAIMRSPVVENFRVELDMCHLGARGATITSVSFQSCLCACTFRGRAPFARTNARARSPPDRIT